MLGEYPDTPEGNLQKNVKGSIAEYEREKIRERTMRGRHNIARSGKVVTHGRPLYGYRLSDDGKLKILVIFEPEARIVRLVFLWYIAGDETGKRLSMQAIANKLSEMNVPTWADTHKGVKKTRMAGQWSRTAVQAILKNEAYAGRWVYAKDSNDPVGVTIPAIVDDETWQAAQQQRSDNVIQSKRNTKHDYLMRTRLTCSCGYCVSAHAITPHGTTYFYYRCSSVVQDYADKACQNTTYFSADDVDKLVWDWLKEWLKDPDDLRRKLEAYQAEIERSNAPVLALINVNEGLIANYAEQLERAKTMFQIGVIRQDELIERKTRLENTITKLENERDTFQNRMAYGLTSAQVEGVIQFAHKLSKGIDVADKSFTARRWIIDTLDVRGIISIEDGDKLVDASVIFDDQQHGKRLVLPKRGRKLSVADKSSPTPG